MSLSAYVEFIKAGWANEHVRDPGGDSIMEIYAFINFYAICFTICVWLNIILTHKKTASRFTILAIVLVIRFAPLLLGLEWRCFLRSKLNTIVAIFLLAWGAYSIILFIRRLRTEESKVRLYVDGGLIIASLLLCYLLIVFQLDYHDVKDSVLKQNGQPTYVYENLDSGSMSMVVFGKMKI